MQKNLRIGIVTSVLLLSYSLNFPVRAEGGSEAVTPTHVIDAATYSGTGDVHVEAGQNVVIDFSNAPGGLFLSGNLINNGNLYAISTLTTQNSASFFATNIVNNAGALFTTILPSGGISGFGSAISNLSLNLTATNNVSNYGSITSSANLNIVAANSITNSSSSGYIAAMTAAQNLNLQMASLINSGTLAAQNNINLASQLNQALSINNANGLINALGNINVINTGLLANSSPLTVLGGNWVGQNLNLNGGSGFITAHLNSVDGRINAIGGGAEISNVVGDLILGTVQCSGDPTISSANDLILSPENVPGGTLDVSEFLTLLAGKNIIAAGLTSASTNADGKGNLRSLTMKAGLGIDLQSAQMLSLSTASNAGAAGDIVLEAANGDIKLGAMTIDASSSVAGGNINISAKNGSVFMDGTVLRSNSGLGSAGNINISSDGGGLSGKGAMFDSTSTAGSGGMVFLSTATGPADIKLPDVLIDTRSVNGTSGDVLIFTGNASTSGSETGTADIDLTNGLILTGSSNGFSGNVSIGAGFATAESDNVTLGSVDTTGCCNGFGIVSISNFFGVLSASAIKTTGAAIFMSAGSELAFTELDASSTVGSGGTISLSMNSSTPFQPGSMNVDGLDGGTIIVSNFGTGGISMNGQSIIAATGVGGTLLIDSSGPLSLTGTYSLRGPNGGGTLSANSAGTFELGASIDTSSSGGTGGSISIGGAELNADGAVLKSERSASSLSSGGSISVFAGAVNGGALDITGGVVLVDAGSIANSSLAIDTSSQITSGGESLIGGPITISTGFELPSLLSLNANGSNGGGGGLVTITNTGSGPLELAGNGININSKGGGEGARGGALTVISSGSLSASSGVWDLSAGTNGQGGAISLAAGTNGATGSTLQVTGEINVSGNGTGNGGSIDVSLNTSDGDLFIGKNGNVSRMNASGANGGNITISAGRNLEVFGGRLNVSATAENGDGGNIKLNAGAASTGTITVQSTLRADGVGSGSGGKITFNESTGSNLVLNAGVTANGGATGNGGTLTVSAKSIGSSIVIGSPTKSVSLRADGGSSSGNGGNIEVATSGNLDLSNGLLSARAFNNGDGGKIKVDLTADPASISFGSEGRMTVDAGNELGTGGTVSIHSDHNLTLSGGRISAQSASSAGGKIDINVASESSGDRSIDTSTVLWANGKSQEDGDIIFSSEAHKLIVNSTGVLYGKVSGKASDVTIIANAADRDLNLFEVIATNGNVLVEANGLNADLRTLGGGMIKAAGNGVSSGGDVTLRAGRDIRVLADSSITSRDSAERNGGNITLVAAGLDGANVQEGFIRIAGTVDASGKTQGGNITLRSRSDLANSLSGTLRSDASESTGTGGAITMQNADKLLNLQITNTGIISSSPTSTSSPLFITTGNGDINIDVAPGAVLKAPIVMSGKQIDLLVRGDFRDVTFDGVTAQQDANLTVSGANSSLIVTGVVTASNIELESRHIINKGTISGSSSGDSVVTLFPGSGSLTLQNNGIISASTSSTADITAATVSIGGNQNVNIEGDGTIQGRTVKVTSGGGGTTLVTGNQTIVENTSATSSVSIETNRLVINPNASVTIKSNIEGGENNLSEIRATVYENNGTISSTGLVSVRLQTDSSESSSMTFESTGKWIAPRIWFSHLNQLGVSNTVKGTMGTVQNKDGGDTVLQFRDTVNRVDLTFLGGSVNATWEPNPESTAKTLTVMDSFSLQMADTSSNSRIAVSKNVAAFNNLFLKNNSSTGTISIGQDVSLTAGKTLQISVGTVDKNNFATTAPANVQVNGALGNGSKGTILLSPEPNSPLFNGAMSTITIPAGNQGKIIIYDGGSSPDSQIIFEGGNSMGLVAIGFTEQIISSNTSLRESAIDGMKFWYFDKPEFHKNHEQKNIVKRGQFILEAVTDLELGIGPATMIVKKGAIVFAERQRHGFLVRNIADQKRGSVLVEFNGQQHEVVPGGQLTLGEMNEGVPTRNQNSIRTPYGVLSSSEYSLPALLGTELVKSMRHSQSDYLRKKTNWIEKSAACIGMVRTKQGPFSTKESSRMVD